MKYANNAVQLKHAMVMTVNANFNILQRFIDLYDDEKYDFYILVDEKCNVPNCEVVKKMPEKSRVYFLPRIEISWGGYSQIEAYLYLLKESTKGKYDYYHFFQGSDFPVRTADEFSRFIEENNGYEFIEILKVPPKTFKRCNRYHFFTNNRFYRKFKWLKAADYGIAMILHAFGIRKNYDTQIYYGAALTSITHRCAKLLISEESQIKKRFRFSSLGDELFVQTVVGNSNFAENIWSYTHEGHGNLRYVDWVRGGPYIFREQNFEELTSLGNSVFFARKFNEKVDMKIVEMLDEYLKIKKV